MGKRTPDYEFIFIKNIIILIVCIILVAGLGRDVIH
jgi:hypothetical protein